MTQNIDLDAQRQKQSSQPMLPFAGGDLDRSGIRLTRAEFARFLEVSKQAVTDWVKSGKIVLGADGRLDPRQAVSQLLRSTDPARLRSKVLAPLVKDVGKFQQCIADLETKLALSEEKEKFLDDSFSEIDQILDTLVLCLRFEWAGLRELDTDTALASIEAWLEKTRMHGPDPHLEILSFAFPAGKPEPDILGAPESMEGVGGDHPDLDEMFRQVPEALEGIE